MSFELDMGCAMARGPRSQLEDFVGCALAPAHQASWGGIAAVADGVSSGGAGLMAAQTTVMTLLSDYHATPATWDTTVALDRILGAQNAWLVDHNRRQQDRPKRAQRADPQLAMTTLTALVLRGQGYTLAHVGDSRAALIRAGEYTPLSQDHTMGGGVFENGLTRAMGMDNALRLDFQEGDLQVGDCFVLTSDGVHGVLKVSQVLALTQEGSAQEVADALVAKAIAAGGRDNASAVVIRIKGLAAATLADVRRQGEMRPIPPRLQAGDTVDGMRVDASVFSNGVHRLYKVWCPRLARHLALKTLHESRASDPEERAMLAHEGWLSGRATERDARGLVKAHEAPPGALAFYILYDWLEGRTLADRLSAGERFEVPDLLEACTQVVRAVGKLHQMGIVHRDIKPDNLHQGTDGHWRVLDLGVALSGQEPKALQALHAGTPSYMNPEQWSDDPQQARPGPHSDLFALGVTLYTWLTGRLPYGEVEPYQVGRYRRDPVAPSRIRPDVPIWLDQIALKAVARDPKQRFETAEEMLLALERGASRPLGPARHTPLLQRDPAAVWKIGLAFSVLFNLLLLYWVLVIGAH